MQHPTNRQQQVLDWIRSHIRREGVPPTRAAGNLLTWLLYVVTVVALLYGIWF